LSSSTAPAVTARRASTRKKYERVLEKSKGPRIGRGTSSSSPPAQSRGVITNSNMAAKARVARAR
jgi:hypothetical protein